MMNMNMSMMGDPALAGVHIFDSTQFYEPPKPRYIFQMPRVVPDQKDKFESDDIFKKISRDCEVSEANRAEINLQLCVKLCKKNEKNV